MAVVNLQEVWMSSPWPHSHTLHQTPADVHDSVEPVVVHDKVYFWGLETDFVFKLCKSTCQNGRINQAVDVC